MYDRELINLWAEMAASRLERDVRRREAMAWARSIGRLAVIVGLAAVLYVVSEWGTAQTAAVLASRGW